MATIGKIREQRNFLLVIIVIAMLLFLIPYDAILSYFQKSDVGNINGYSISISEWQQENQKRENTNLSYGSGRENAVWSDMKEGLLLGSDYEELGIGVSDDEYNDLTIYGNPSAFVKSTFSGQTQDYVGNYEYHVSTIPKNTNGYAALKELIINKRKREKWDKLVSKGMYSNSLDAKYDYKWKNDKRTIDYIFMSFADYNLDSVIVSDSEVKEYFNAHKNDPKFEVLNESREIKYVEFKIDPSDADIAALTATMTTLNVEWSKAKNDTAFLSLHNTSAQSSVYVADTYAGIENDKVLNDSIGSIVGPFETTAGAGATLIRNLTSVKVIDRLMYSDSVQCRHILLAVDNTMNQMDVFNLRAKADSIMGLIKDGTQTFEAMVFEHTEDPGSKTNGGNYGWFKEDANYVQPYKDFTFENEVGDIEIVPSQFGFHIMEVVDQSPKVNPRTRIVAVNKVIRPSSETVKAFYKEADNFSTAAEGSFEIAADTLGFTPLDAKNVFRTSTRVGTLADANEVVSFIYNNKTKAGSVSQPILMEGKYVVVKLDKIKPVGTPMFENVEEEMRKGALNKKMAANLVALMDKGSLEEVEEATGARRKSSTLSLSQNNIPNSGASGQDPEVVGFSFGIAEGQMSDPIVGNNGVYVIAPTGFKEGVAKDFYVDEQEALIKKQQGNAGNLLIQSMERKAGITDERYTE